MSNIECLPKFCDNPMAPNTTMNFNFTWDGELVAIDQEIKFSCNDNMRLEENIARKEDASDHVMVLCGNNSEFIYPDEWPQCSKDINCGPPVTPPANVSRTWLKGRSEPDSTYKTFIEYNCEDGSKFDTDEDGIGETDSLKDKCNWNKRWRYSALPACIITHCIHPFAIPNDTSLVTSDGWTSINKDRTYECEGWNTTGDETHVKFFETDRSKTSFTMKCKDDGNYEFVNKRENWPTCLSTVHCGQPPNATEDGYREWTQSHRQESDDTYNTNVRYRCINGSQFDTNGEGAGVSAHVDITCLWNKIWSPWPVLPACIISHCVDPYEIPENTSLEVSFDDWTPIRTEKEYQCSGMTESIHTKFFEYDRSKSSFGMRCLDNGTFLFNNETQHWPICVEGKIH